MTDVSATALFQTIINGKVPPHDYVKVCDWNQSICFSHSALHDSTSRCLWPGEPVMVHTTWLMLAFHQQNYGSAVRMIEEGARLARDDPLHDDLFGFAVDMACNPTCQKSSLLSCFRVLRRFGSQLRQWFIRKRHLHRITLWSTVLASVVDMACKNDDGLCDYMAQEVCVTMVLFYNCDCPIDALFWPQNALKVFQFKLQDYEKSGYYFPKQVLTGLCGEMNPRNRHYSVDQTCRRLFDVSLAFLPMELPALIVAQLLCCAASFAMSEEVAFARAYFKLFHDKCGFDQKPILSLFGTNALQWKDLYQKSTQLLSFRRLLLTQRQKKV